MKVLVIGSGGREHTLCWKIAQSDMVEKVYCTPGNAGISDVAECISISADDQDSLLKFAEENGINLTVVGPEQPLVDGIVDRFRAKGLTIYGPDSQCAVLEGSKIFSKEFMERHGLPTAKYKVYNNPKDVRNAIEKDEFSFPLVIKADGLAAGKGVIICLNSVQAMDAVKVIMEDRSFGDAGLQVVVEEFLLGFEASIHIITDGNNYVQLPTAKDHKKIYDGETGPNTGGMGAISPSPDITEEQQKQVEELIIKPFMDGLKKDKMAFTGTVFFGLMFTHQGPYVLEFNVRFGDPETEVILPRMKSDLVPLLLSAAKGCLEGQAELSDQIAVNVVAVSRGYPGPYQKGIVLTVGDDIPADTIIFHAGTKREDNTLVTSGGRVISATALGDSLESARTGSYRAVKQIHFDGITYRNDIGKQ